MRLRAPMSIVAGIVLLAGLLAIPASPASAQLPGLPLPVETPELPELPVGDLPLDLPLDQVLGLLDVGGLGEVLACITGAGLPDASDPSPDAVIGVLLCIIETAVALLSEAVAALLGELP